MKDDEAISLLKDGNICGLDALIQHYQVRALRVAYLITKDQSLAEDIVQSAFIRVYEKIHQLNEVESFRPWLMKIIVNQALQIIMKDIDSVSLDNIKDNTNFDTTSPISSLDTIIENVELTSSLRTATNQLSILQRTVIVQRYYLNMTEAEMADDLNCSQGTIKSRLHAARHRLKCIIEDDHLVV